MKNIPVPTYYKPSRVIFVDDNRSFIESIGFLLPDSVHTQTYTNPKDTILDLKKYNCKDYMPKLNPEEKFEREDDEFYDYFKCVSSSKRFEEISVLVTDYSMPQMSGLELCDWLRDIPFKKILLTGEAGNATAVEAFNEGLIHGFVLKDSTDYDEQLIQQIHRSNRDYFYEMSTKLCSTYFLERPSASSVELAKDFLEFCSQNQITEYYLLDHHGSYVCFDTEGQIKLYLVKSESDINEFLAFIEIESKSSIEIIDTLKNKTKFPCLFTLDALNDVPSHWMKYMVNVDKIIKDEAETFYVSTSSHSLAGEWLETFIRFEND